MELKERGGELIGSEADGKNVCLPPAVGLWALWTKHQLLHSC